LNRLNTHFFYPMECAQASFSFSIRAGFAMKGVSPLNCRFAARWPPGLSRLRLGSLFLFSTLFILFQPRTRRKECSGISFKGQPTSKAQSVYGACQLRFLRMTLS
jgi:hypothetical protein